MRVCAGKNRIVQVASAGSRKLFDGERRELFLEWFAATCNVKLSAAKAGVAYQTVFKHRMKDPGFAEAWDRALAQGYARLEARLLEEACPSILPGTGRGTAERQLGGGGVDPSVSPVGLPPPRSGEDFEGETEAPFDPQLALAILREQKRNVHGATPKMQRTTARAATNGEIADALAKRLKAFALRVGQEEAPPPADAFGSGWSPSPANAGEDECAMRRSRTES